MKKVVLAVTTIIVASAYPLVGIAQTEIGSSDNVDFVVERSVKRQVSSTNVIEEIMVTARRTEESLQEVPVSITAMSGDDLQRESIGSAQDLAGKVPSLVINSVSQMRNTQSPTIRGQGANFTGSPGVILYFNEVPLPEDSFSNAQGGPGMFFDLQNMQVLKGPQGTLFGRNTTGGALLLEPAKPTEDFHAMVQAEKGNYSLGAIEGMINLPLVNDQLMLRVSAKKYRREGFTIDVANGRDYDDKHYDHYRWGLMWRPTETFENYLMGYRTNVEQNGTGMVVDRFNTLGLAELAATLSPGALPPGLSDEEIGCLMFSVMVGPDDCGASTLADQKRRGIRKIELGGDPINQTDISSFINSTSWQFTDTLELRNIASYSRYERLFRWDQDGSGLILNDTSSPDGTKSSNTSTTTEELQLLGTALEDRLKFVVGYYWERFEPEGQQENWALVFGGLTTVTQVYHTKRDSYGPYAQGTYNLADLGEWFQPMNLTVGVRRSTDDIFGSTQGQLASGEALTGSIKSSATTWMVSLDYQTNWGLLYAKVSRGYKNGGFSPVSVNPDHFTYDPEYVKSYELGVKSDFTLGEMPVRLNAATYYTDYTDLQKTGTDLVPNSISPIPDVGAATYNAGEAWIRGFEMDATLQPFTGFRLMVNYSYTDAAYEEFKLNHAGLLDKLDCSGSRKQGELDLSCIPYQSVPQHQYSVSARYLLPLTASVGEVEASVTYSWVDEQYTAATSLPADEPGAWIDDFDLINASLAWYQIFGSNFNLQLFVTNLEDKQYRISNSNVWREVYYKSDIWGEPRMYGARLSYRWGE